MIYWRFQVLRKYAIKFFYEFRSKCVIINVASLTLQQVQLNNNNFIIILFEIKLLKNYETVFRCICIVGFQVILPQIFLIIFLCPCMVTKQGKTMVNRTPNDYALMRKYTAYTLYE